MSPVLVYVISGAIIALTVALLPLLQQLTRTASSAERFLDSAKEDLRRIQEDVHAARVRVESLTTSAQTAVDQMNGLVRSVGDLGTSLKSGVAGLMGGFGGGRSSGFGLSGILGILTSLIALFRRPN